MEAIHFIWNKEKAIANQQKHGISFDEAKTVFYDENARLRHDPDHSMDEDRFLLLGISQLLRILVVCHCYREDDLQIRIISARKATKAERKQYELFRS